MSRRMITIDGNTAVANVAHAINEVIAIYPITPSSGMGEVADERSAKGLKNIWGTIPHVVEMQSEGGAAGAVHGALSTGALSTTFTASQGLLLMIPNMFKIAGELAPTVFHVSARSIASHALSIFGDHSDVMAVRSTGFGLIASGSVQEAADFTLIATAASLESRVPFVHFFDGFRTTHEVAKIEELNPEDMQAMIDDKLVIAHRKRALTPDRPTLKGTAQNPDVFFQSRETINKFYDATPAIVQKYMDKFAKLTGRQYKLFEYFGAPDAERVIITMASSTATVHETVDYLVSKGEKVGLIKARLYRPFDSNALVEALPPTVKVIACLDRTKEAGAIGEPLYIDVRTGVGEVMGSGESKFNTYPVIVGGRYGLGSKDLTPAMIKAVYDNITLKTPKNHFTVGINDDVTGTSLDYDESFHIDDKKGYNAMFYGLGSDGTVGANKNTIKIIGENTENYAQGYFVYDSKKAGAITTSHVRFGPVLIRKPYLIDRADFVACHNFSFLEKYDMFTEIVEGGTFLLNSPFGPDEVWDKIPAEVQKQIIDKKLRFWIVDGIDLGLKLGLGARINMIMQTAFFAISKVIPEEQAFSLIKDAIKKTYGKKGEKIVQMNYNAVDAAKDNVFEVKYPNKVTSTIKMPPIVPDHAPDFVKNVTATIMSGKGDKLPVSAMPIDGTFPTGTTQFEKRNIAVQIPEWDPDTCIQCGQCSLVCPHAAIRIKAYDPSVLGKAPDAFKSIDAKGPQFKGLKFTVQVAPEDCTGCGMCVWNCPALQKDAEGNKTDRHAINMVSQFEIRKQEAENYDFFLSIPETDPSLYKRDSVKGSQLIRPLFEYSGACAGCGETAYVKLLSQLFGDRALIANATGCSSIYGGNLPTTPYTTRDDGRGPTWSNSLFEDNAEFGFGFRLTIDKFKELAGEYLQKAVNEGLVDKALAEKINAQNQTEQEGIEAQRANVAELTKALEAKGNSSGTAAQLLSLADYLVEKSVWVLGGDGWAYDIGYGGLDHVLASGRNVNVLVLDTEVYSNTGGQMSKSTPRGATAKFAASGKPLAKKDLGMMAMTYGNVYVAKVALGANPNQVVKAFAEAAAYNGPSLIIAYAHCIAHGINMTAGLGEQKKAVASGHWPLFRYNPDLADQGKNPLQLDSKEPTMSFAEYAFGENRYMVLKKAMPEHAEELSKLAQKDVDKTQKMYRSLAAIPYDNGK
ncbi:MAG: pyruvate:ferredoxin (flavodoxin) oxidoreductase [Candidatus Latescibacteria bacterium]|nr:pyruvate:ferredoxin (flavodoxin) oxidoreductase [Candidatus Latescibacterota bacterium]